MSTTRPLLGAEVTGAGVRFGAYATEARTCAVRLFDGGGRAIATHSMRPVCGGYYEARVEGARAGALYKLVVGDRELPDPYARWLPKGVHGPAEVVAPTAFAFRHARAAPRLAEQVLYEIHVGTFTPEGTYDAARRRLGYLATLGVRCVELMPIASFAGARGWGYDGVAHYAPFAPYGSPDDLRRFVDDAHGLGLSVVLDVVYNHFGPAGNYLRAYSEHYFTKKGATPWGDAPNFAHPAMRRYAIDNAVYWLDEFRFDGLRLDAIHAIEDDSEEHVLRALTREAKARGKVLLFAEDERNDPDTVRALGFDAVWADDFHHQVRVTLTGERDGYYASYEPGARGIAEAITRGWLFEGQTYAATGRPRGKPALEMLAESFVYCLENHDQIGNRAFGDRLSSSVPVEAYCAASMLLLFLPMTPLLFMGQEWAASTPFLYFTDHDAELGKAITGGRRAEMAGFAAFDDAKTREAIPDPQSPETFARSKLKWEERRGPRHARVLALHREMLHLRRTDPVLRHASRDAMTVEAKGDVLVVRRALDADVRVLCVSFGASLVPLARLELAESDLLPVLASRDPIARDALPPRSAVILAGRSPRESRRPTRS